MNLTPERIELLRKVKRQIGEFPLSYNQSRWAKVADESPCGTACCIAGWTCLLSGEYEVRPRSFDWDFLDFVHIETMKDVSPMMAAQALLGMSQHEAETAFAGHPSEVWPEPYASEWGSASPGLSGTWQEDRAKVAYRYIDYIIEHGRVD